MAGDDTFNPNAGCPAGLKLWGHVLKKGVEAGGVLAVPIVGGVAAYGLYRGRKPAELDVLALAQAAGVTTLAGLGLSAVMGSLKLLQIDRAGIEDRVYRLHYNESQRRTDVFSTVGIVAGLAAAGWLLKDSSAAKPLHYAGAAGLGAAGGVLLHVLTRPQDQKTPNKMVHELRY